MTAISVVTGLVRRHLTVRLGARRITIDSLPTNGARFSSAHFAVDISLLCEKKYKLEKNHEHRFNENKCKLEKKHEHSFNGNKYQGRIHLHLGHF